MNLNLRKWAVPAAATAMLAALTVVGCSSNKRESDAPAAASQPAPSKAAPSGAAVHEMTPGMVMPAGTVPEIWTQIAGEQDKLTAALNNGQLKDVHHLAFGIRDLVVALADTAKAASPEIAVQIDNQVEQVKTSATRLGELGDAGDLGGTQKEYAKLVAILEAIKSVTSAK